MVTFFSFHNLNSQVCVCVRNAAGQRRAYSSEQNVIHAGKEQFVS